MNKKELLRMAAQAATVVAAGLMLLYMAAALQGGAV